MNIAGATQKELKEVVNGMASRWTNKFGATQKELKACFGPVTWTRFRGPVQLRKN